MNILKQLIDLGYPPFIAVTIAAVVVLWVVVLKLNRSNIKTRIEWHTETQKRVDKFQVHIDECNMDREQLKVKVAVLEERTLRLSNCPRAQCPMRLP